MSLLIAMTAAGSIPVIQYYFLKWIWKGKGEGRRYRLLLRTAMFFFLCPFQELKYRLPIRLPAFMYHLREKSYLKREGYVLFRDLEGDYSLVAVWVLVLAVVWIVAAAVVVVFQLFRYARLKSLLRKTSCPVSEKQFEVSGNKKGKRVACAKNRLIRTPFTVGGRKHWIILPETELDQEELQMILLHETAHIKNRDLLLKFVCLGICLLHWFNPFAWLLLYEYGVTSEKICDEQVAASLETMEQRKKYAALLVKLAVDDSKIPFAFADHFSREGKGKRSMKKRIEQILHPEKKKTGFFPVALTLSVILSASTALAYTIPAAGTGELYKTATEGEFILDASSVGTLDFSVSDTIFLSDEYTESFREELVENKVLIEDYDFSASDTIFTEDKTGRKTALLTSNDTKIVCQHTFTSGTTTRHIKNNSGGCVIRTYKVKKCTKCTYYEVLEMISETKYTKCPH